MHLFVNDWQGRRRISLHIEKTLYTINVTRFFNDKSFFYFNIYRSFYMKISNFNDSQLYLHNEYHSEHSLKDTHFRYSRFFVSLKKDPIQPSN